MIYKLLCVKTLKITRVVYRMPRGKKQTTETLRPLRSRLPEAAAKKAAEKPAAKKAASAAKPVETKWLLRLSQPKLCQAEVVPQLTQDFTEFMAKLQQVTQLMSGLRTGSVSREEGQPRAQGRRS